MDEIYSNGIDSSKETTTISNYMKKQMKDVDVTDAKEYIPIVADYYAIKTVIAEYKQI